MRNPYPRLIALLLLVGFGCDTKKQNGAKATSERSPKSLTEARQEARSLASGKRQEGSVKPGTNPVSSLCDDGLLKTYKDSGTAGVLRKLDGMGPGTNRREAITGMIIEAAVVEGGLSEWEFAQVFELIDRLPYEEDKGGLSGPFLDALVGVQAVGEIMKVMGLIESPALKLALATSLGVKAAGSDGGEVAKVVNGLDAAAKVSFLCNWAARLPKGQRLTPDGFGKMLSGIALGAEDEKVAINSYVNSLGSASGKELLAYSKTAANPVLAAELLTKGYSVWLKEDSMAASAELVKSKDLIEAHAYDKIVQDLVMQLKRHNDLPAASQWAATVSDEEIRKRLLLILEN